MQTAPRTQTKVLGTVAPHAAADATSTSLGSAGPPGRIDRELGAVASVVVPLVRTPPRRPRERWISHSSSIHQSVIGRLTLSFFEKTTQSTSTPPRPVKIGTQFATRDRIALEGRTVMSAGAAPAIAIGM